MTGTDDAALRAERSDPNTEVAVLLHDGVTALVAIGPYEILGGMPGAEVKFVAKAPGPVRTDSGFLSLTADYPLDNVPEPDVLLVPFLGPAAMGDERLLAWIRSAHRTSRWTTSVCAGSLMLGAAGLLDGLRATGHWVTKDILESFGATYVPDERYVRQGRIVTAAGVSSGIDMALYLVGEIAGAKEARVRQLMTEYDTKPPFDAGSAAKADREVVELAAARYRGLVGGLSAERGARP